MQCDIHEKSIRFRAFSAPRFYFFILLSSKYVAILCIFCYDIHFEKLHMSYHTLFS